MFFMIVLGIGLFYMFPALKDFVFSTTDSIWLRLPVLALPIFYLIGVVFAFVNTVRGVGS